MEMVNRQVKDNDTESSIMDFLLCAQRSQRLFQERCTGKVYSGLVWMRASHSMRQTMKLIQF